MVDITFTLPDGYIDELKEGYFKVFPVPSGSSDLDWFKTTIRKYVLRTYKRGKRQIATESAIPEFEDGDNLITSS